MITLTDRDRFIILALLSRVPVLSLASLFRHWPDNDSGRENALRRLEQLCAEGLLERHVAHARVGDVSLFYYWAPGLPVPELGALAWTLAGLWERTEPRRVTFFTAGETAARHYGGTIRHPLKSAPALAHNLGLGAVFQHYADHTPLLAGAWVAEEVVAASRGYGESVVDACIIDSTSTPALAVEFCGASYAASNGERLREIHADCAARHLPYEAWTITRGEMR